MKKRYFKLLITNPRDFIYSVLCSSDKKTKLFEFNPKSLTIAQEIIKKIKSKINDSIITLVGSAGLQIPGRKEIDIVVETRKSSLKKNIKILTEIFGAPAKTRRTFAEWNFKYKGYYVELTLAVFFCKISGRMLYGYRLLKQNPKLRQKYIELKRKNKNAPEREYNIIRTEFFDNILK